MYANNIEFNRDPRSYALQLVEDGLVDAESLLLCALNHMSHDDVKRMLDSNELSPRFSSEYYDDENDVDEAQEWADYDPDC